MDSLKQADAAAAAVQKTPNRVTLDYIEGRISNIEYMHPTQTPHMTIAILTMVNGYTVIGKSAPADAGNFDAELGRKFAYEDGVRQIWPLEGFALRERLTE